MDKKDYRKWSFYKSFINNYKDRVKAHEREIWLCALGENIGFEQNGKGKRYVRPVIIFKKFSSDACLIIPITSTKKVGPFYFHFNIQGIENVAILSQIRFIDNKRLLRQVAYISFNDFYLLKQKFRHLIA